MTWRQDIAYKQICGRPIKQPAAYCQLHKQQLNNAKTSAHDIIFWLGWRWRPRNWWSHCIVASAAGGGGGGGVCRKHDYSPSKSSWSDITVGRRVRLWNCTWAAVQCGLERSPCDCLNRALRCRNALDIHYSNTTQLGLTMLHEFCQLSSSSLCFWVFQWNAFKAKEKEIFREIQTVLFLYSLSFCMREETRFFFIPLLIHIVLHRNKESVPAKTHHYVLLWCGF